MAHIMYSPSLIQGGSVVMLQYNRLEVLPDEVFVLPGLVTLDVSNNKLSCLPHRMWRAPKLKELNAAFNLLRDLPTLQPDVSNAKSLKIYTLHCFILISKINKFEFSILFLTNDLKKIKY